MAARHDHARTLQGKAERAVVALVRFQIDLSRVCVRDLVRAQRGITRTQGTFFFYEEKLEIQFKIGIQYSKYSNIYKN